MDDHGTDRGSSERLALRYSLRRYLAAFILVSIGTAAWLVGHNISVAWSKSPERFHGLPPSVAICWIIAGVTIGAGVFALWKRTVLGALLGLAVSGSVASLAMYGSRV